MRLKDIICVDIHPSLQLVDRQDVVMDKVLYLATLLRASRRSVIYTGPGLSASCRGKTNARPSQGHAVLATLVTSGLADSWVQTCHDGLAQKAGCPQEKVLEVAGSWFDPCNPVVRKNGNMRQELKVIGKGKLNVLFVSHLRQH